MGRMKEVVRKAQAAPTPTFVASAANVADMTQQEVSRVKSDIGWQQRCYSHYHTIGEYRFACDWKGNMLSKAILHAGLNKQDGKGVQTQALVRYVAGCIHRERKRVAEILRDKGEDPEIVNGILSDADDATVFKWGGPSTDAS